MDMIGRVIMVTGAGSGLGAAVACMAVAGGATAIILDVNERAGEAMAAELGPNAVFHRCDVTDAPAAEAAIAAVLRKFGRLDAAVNCAGIAPGERILGRDGAHRLESFRRTVEINLIRTFNMLRLSAEAMHKMRRGQMVSAA